MERINNKLDAIANDITDLKVMIAKNTTILDRNVEDIAHHIRRTNILETQMNTALLPIKLVGWFVAFIPVLAFVVGLIQLLR